MWPQTSRRTWRRHFRPRLLPLLLVALLAVQLVAAASPSLAAPPRQAPLEPTAGTWKTWALSSGSELRLPAPPNRAATQAELRELKAMAGQRAATADQIAEWTGNGPIYPWSELALETAARRGVSLPPGSRILTLLNVAIYDATIAAWDSKYAHNRPRPSVQLPPLGAAAPVPNSPSYPSEHAAVAAAASAVLAHLFPNDAALFEAKAAEAGQTVQIAGLNYPSDVAAGAEIGKAVAARVIEIAKSDGSALPWTGSVPTGPGYWTGTNPALPTAGTWRTWVLSSGSELRPGPRHAYDSPELAAELQELRDFQRTPQTNAMAQFWEYGAGGARLHYYWNEILQRKVLEYGLADNPPRAARAFLLPNLALYEVLVACWDAKYTYWAMRPSQVDPTFSSLFPSPNHPSYPSAHSCFSQSVSATMAYLFPRDAASFYALADQASESRVGAAGIHFRSDVTVGKDLGWAVAQRVIERAKADGS
ncbi:MAG TPA: phosphatase PAP2 family protein [Chloroflexaceae bacterium]|nr:phosphatase PAP2 family protein [Chloroflexaceae bacterium]